MAQERLLFSSAEFHIALVRDACAAAFGAIG